MTEEEKESDGQTVEVLSAQGENESKTRPLFVWVLGIVLLLISVGGTIAGIVTGRITQAPGGIVMILIFGFLGLGLFTGKRVALILLRILWVLWVILVVISLFAAMTMGAIGIIHIAGFVFALILLPVWAEDVREFCDRKLLS